MNKKLNLIKEFESDLEKERAAKNDLMKQLKDFKQSADS